MQVGGDQIDRFPGLNSGFSDRSQSGVPTKRELISMIFLIISGVLLKAGNAPDADNLSRETTASES